MTPFAILFFAIFALWLFQPFAKTICVHITDDAGKEVANASVEFGWTTGEPWGPSVRSGTSHSRTTKTDLMGRASARISEESLVGISVTHPQHWRSSVSVVGQDLSRHGTPETALEIVLKRIIAPKPLIAKRAYIWLPTLSGEAAYDFVVGDLVAPHGKGVSPDAWFVWSQEDYIAGRRDPRSWDLSFREPGSGIIARFYSTKSEVVRSELAFDQSAPISGYLPSLRSAEVAADPRGEREWHQEPLYYLRIVRDGGALYGVIAPPEPEISFFTNHARPQVRLTYVLNPAGDLGLEPALGAISFPRANPYEEPFKLW